MDSCSEKLLFEKIRNDDNKAFRLLFETYYPSLCNYAAQFLKSKDLAEEVVQTLFVRIWEKRKTIEIDTSVKYYLFKSARNLCINSLQHQKVIQMHALKMQEDMIRDFAADSYFIDQDVIDKIEGCIAELPEKRREIFRLSREQGLKYREIAEKLNISVKTVEAQMGLALKFLRQKFQNFTLLLFYFGK